MRNLFASSRPCFAGFVRLVALVLACAGAAGCKGNDTAKPPSPPPPPPPLTGPSCASLVAQCVANQQGCVEGSAGATCQACMPGTYAASSGACTVIDGTPLPHDFPDQTTTAGQEQLGNCRSWTLNNDAEIWVNAVEMAQNELSHHSNFVFVPDTDYAGPDGIWPCADRSYDFYSGIAAGGLLYAQSTQATHEAQRFPTGAAIRIPPHARLVSDTHLLNTTNETVTGHYRLTLYTLAAASVTVTVRAFHVEYDALAIPPLATSRFTGQCSVAADVTKATGSPFAPKVLYLLPHTHTLATGFFAKIMGGPHDGESMIDLGAYDGEAHGRTYDPPVDLSGADGVQFACTYTNPRTETVGWGLGSQEMCELIAFAETPNFFQSRVNTGAAAGTDGDVQLFSGSCDTMVFPAN